MENKKRKPIIVIVYGLINVLYGMSLGIIVFWVGFYLIHFFIPSINIPILWDASYQMDFFHKIGPDDNSKFDFYLYVAGSKMMLYSNLEKLTFLSFAYHSIIIFVTTFLISSLKNILKNIYDGNPFFNENILLIRWIGIILIVTPIVLDFTKYMLFSSMPSNLVMEIKQWNAVFLTYVYKPMLTSFNYLQWLYMAVGGLIIIVLAEVFKYGLQLKQENDLTV